MTPKEQKLNACWLVAIIPLLPVLLLGVLVAFTWEAGKELFKTS